MRSAFNVVGLLVLVVLQSSSQTLVPAGDVSGIWNVAGSPFLVLGDITVPNESTLVIDPGVNVIFQGHYALNVQGRLLAIGTPVDSIHFTVNDTTGFSNVDSVQGGWYGIRLIDTPPTNDSTILAYCSLEFGKAIGPGYPSNTGGAISITNFDKVRISSCLIAHSIAGGSSFPGGGAIGLTVAGVVLSGNLIADNLSTGQGGGILLNGAKLWSTQNRYVGNSTSGPGGAVVIEGGSFAAFHNDSLVNNSSANNGGGIEAFGQPRISMDGSSFVGNSAYFGGAMAVYSCTLSVSNCAFARNTATMDGGAIGATHSMLEIGGNIFNGNRCGSEGGGIFGLWSDLSVRSSSLGSNRAGNDSLTGTGGAIYAEHGVLHIDSCSFQRDTAWMAAGLRLYDCDLLADSVLIQDNHSYNIEGGLYWSIDTIGFTQPYTLSLRRVGFLRNSANSYGAGLIVQPTTDASYASFLIDRCLFQENYAAVTTSALGLSGTFKGLVISNTAFRQNVVGSRTAGLSFAGGAQGLVFNCLFAGNQVTGSPSVGAGLSMGASCDVDVANCTFAFNSANSGSALSVRSGTKARVTNSVFWKNSGAYIALGAVASAGAFVNANYCNFQHAQDSITVSDSLSSFLWGSGNVDGDPRFVDSLGTDFHLSTASHCIAAGIDSIKADSVWQWAPLTDIEGLPRPRPLGTRPDMGAFEEQLTTPAGVALKSDGEVPLAFGLEQNFPNPFNPKTGIRFQVSGVSDVRLTVYDILGREVALLVNEKKMPGRYETEFNASGLASGVYIYRLTTGAYVECRKMVLMK